MIAEIRRDKYTKMAKVEVFKSAPWELFAGNTVNNIDYSIPIISGETSGVFDITVPRSERIYFSFRSGEESCLLSERLLPMEGGYNFRDLGGIRTKDGRDTAWGKIFRGDELKSLTSDDLAYLSSISLVSIVDFRTHEEKTEAPDRFPESILNSYHLCVMPGAITLEMFEESIQNNTELELMKKVYEQFICDEKVVTAYRKFFRILQEGENLPLLFHCSAGKDRTGIAAALILFSLGVDECDIMKDYLASAEYLAGKYPVGSELFSVREEFMHAALNMIRLKHNSIENYLENVLNVNSEKMRSLFLS